MSETKTCTLGGNGREVTLDDGIGGNGTNQFTWTGARGKVRLVLNSTNPGEPTIFIDGTEQVIGEGAEKHVETTVEELKKVFGL